MTTLLSGILSDVIREHEQRINDLAERYPDQPLEIVLNWHPQMAKVDVVVRVVDHLPPYRVERQRPGVVMTVSAEGSGSVSPGQVSEKVL